MDLSVSAKRWKKSHGCRAEISKASYDLDNYKQIMGVIARRLQDTEEDWRHVYKSLLLLEFLSKHGPQKVAHRFSSVLSCFDRSLLSAADI